MCRKLQEKYIPPISVEEIRKQLTMMKGNKACGPDMIPIEVWKKMGEEGIVFLKRKLNEILTSGIPSSWRLSEETPLFKGKVPYWSVATTEE